MDYPLQEVWTRQDIIDALEEEEVETSVGNIDKMVEIARETFEELDLSDRSGLLCFLVRKNFKEGE